MKRSSWQSNIKLVILAPLLAVLALVAAGADGIEAGTGTKMTMLVFGVPYCASCRLMAPVMNELRKKHQDRLDIHYLDADDNREEARLRRIQALPTQIILDQHGREVTRHLGFWDAESIETQLGLRGASGNDAGRPPTAGKPQ